MSVQRHVVARSTEDLERIPCETCDSFGRVPGRDGVILCPICGGRGWSRKKTTLPSEQADPMLPASEIQP